MERPWRMGASWEGAGPGIRAAPAGAQVCRHRQAPGRQGSAEQVCREPGWRGHRDDQGEVSFVKLRSLSFILCEAVSKVHEQVRGHTQHFLPRRWESVELKDCRR